jgi:hypothetical protein
MIRRDTAKWKEMEPRVRSLLLPTLPNTKSAAEQAFRDARLAHAVVAEVMDMAVDKLRAMLGGTLSLEALLAA